MRELVLICSLGILGAGCVEVVSHRDDFDAGPDITISDGPSEAEVMSGKCTSGKRWTMGNTGSVLMSPGQPCMGSGCHNSSASKNQFTIAGTIYPYGGEHDDNDCNGIDGTGVAIQVLDDSGADLFPRLQLNSVGNFYTNKALPAPPATFHVIVHYQGRQAPMVAPLTDRDGNCNLCHASADFMGAKGRIVPKAP